MQRFKAITAALSAGNVACRAILVIYLRIEIQIFSFHWMMKNIRLF